MRLKDQPELLDQKQAAEFLGLTENTLQAWRSRKQPGPTYIKVGGCVGKAGGRVKYDVKDLLAFLESRKVHSGDENVSE